MDGIKIIADELGEVSARIHELEAQAEKLRQYLINYRPDGPVRGVHYTVNVTEKVQFTFNTALLPDSILEDPAFCRRYLDMDKLPALIRDDDWYYRDVFDPALLGDEIRQDPRYNTVNVTTYVSAKAHNAPSQNMK
ncbi:hypothetical protein [Sulfitobacter sp.]|uniref:hypothetical protein n=1 Tax=Sulfitobacter sp. TaxID=1903071 RepID=UPI003298652E